MTVLASRRQVVQTSLFFIVYLFTVWAGWKFNFPEQNVASVWPADGVFLGVLLLAPVARWPLFVVVAIAAMLLNDTVIHDAPLKASLEFGLSNVVQALVGASLVRAAADPRECLTSLRAMTVLIVFAGVVASCIGALIGAWAIVRAFPTADFAQAFQVWWASDAIGVLVVTPLILVWRTPGHEVAVEDLRVRLPEIAVLSVATLVAAQVVLGVPRDFGASTAQYPYALFPLLAWAAVRGPAAIGLGAAACVGAIAILNLNYGASPFRVVGETPFESVQAAQVFIVLAAGSAIFLTVLVQRDRVLNARAQDFEARVGAVAANIPGVIFRRRMSPDGEIGHDFVSGQTNTIYGVSEDAMAAGQVRVADFIHPDDIEGWREAIRQSVRDMAPHQYVYRTRRKGREERWIRIIASAPVRDETGDYVWDGLTIDVTDEILSGRRAETFENSVQAIANSIPGLILRYVRKGWADIEVEFVLGRVEEVLGVSEAELKANPTRIMEFIHEDDRMAVHEAGEKASASMSRLDVSYRYNGPDGSVRWARSLYTPRRDSAGRIVWEGMTLDVTEEMELRERMRSTQAELARVGRVDMLGQFSSSLSHEISQPIAAIGGYVEAARLLLRRPSPPLDELRDMLQRTAQQIERAGDIMARLRTMSVQRKPEFESVDIHEAVEEAIEFASIDRGGQAVRLIADLDRGLPSISGDRVQLQQVVINLVRNATEAVRDRADGIVRVAAATDPRGVVIRVHDNGPGIAPELRERLFDPFATGREGGTGVGLALCRDIVEAHGGTIAFSEDAGGGTVFEVVLPVAAEDVSRRL